MPFRDLLTNQRQPTATGLFRAGWSADYPTPANFLASLLTTKAIGAATPDDVANGDNRGRYSNPEFDRRLRAAHQSRPPDSFIQRSCSANSTRVATAGVL